VDSTNKNNNLNINSTSFLTNNFYNNKSAISTIIVLILLLFMSIIIFTMVSNFFDFSLNDFKINQELGNFETNFEIINIDGNLLTLQNNFINNLEINSMVVDNIECSFTPNKINLGTTIINTGNCVENLSLETIYSVIIGTNYGFVIENEILEPLTLSSEDFFGQSYMASTPAHLASYVGNSIYVKTTPATQDNISTWTNFDNSLVGYWNFDSGNSTHVFDLSGNLNSGEYINEVTNINLNKIRGNYSKYDGVNDFINLGVKVIYDLQSEFTISVWIRASSSGSSSYQTIINKESSGSGSSDRNFWLSLWGTSPVGSFHLRFSTSSSSIDCDIGDNVDLRDDTWHHLVAIYNGSHCYVVIDSIIEAIDLVIGVPEGIGYPLYFGNEVAGPDRKFDGSMDEIMIFNRTLSQNEINSLYNSKINQYDNNFTNLSTGEHTFETCSINIDGDYKCLDQRNITLS
jgi:hypothetical protein